MFNSYLVNWRLFIKRNTPREMRDERTLSWLYCLITPVRDVYALFLAFRDEAMFRVQFRCQVVYLEKGLNDKFNGGLPAYIGATSLSLGTPSGIYIDNPGDRLIKPYLFRTEELHDGLFIYRTAEVIDPEKEIYMYRSEEYAAQDDYIIYVPIALGDITLDIDLLKQITAFANLYRPSAKHFKVLNY